MNNLDVYNNIFKEVFDLEIEQLNEELIYNTIETWDSIGHMGLIAELEEVFDIMLETDDVIEFSSYLVGKEILKKYNIEI